MRADEIISQRFQTGGPPVVRLDASGLAALQAVKQKLADGTYQASIKPCDICGSDQFVVLAKRDRYGLDVQTAICADCGLVRTNPDLQEPDYVDFYKQHYRRLYIKQLVGDPAAFFGEEYWRGQEIIDFLKRHQALPSQGLVLEVGCGAGGILQAFKDFGLDVVGTDYGATNLAHGRSKGLDLREGGLDTLVLDRAPRLVVYSHVLEHVYDPNRELQRIHELLPEDGIVYIEVPGLLQVRNNYFTADYLKAFHIAHIFNFTLPTLCNLLKRNGFRLVAGDEFVRAVFCKGTVDPQYHSDYRRIDDFIRTTERRRAYYHFRAKLRMSVRALGKLWKTQVISLIKALRLEKAVKRMLRAS